MEVKLKGGKKNPDYSNLIKTTKSIGSETKKSPHFGMMFLKGLRTSEDIIKDEKKGSVKKGAVILKGKVNQDSFNNFVNKLLKNNKKKPFNFVSAQSNL
jgi:hypothetical protein